MTSSDPVSVIGIIVMLVLYLLPTINGYSKKHRSRGLIAAINIFFGWTLVGWVVAAIWSFGSARDDQPTDLTHVKCPDCAELVLREAKVCKHCGYRFESP